MDRRNFLKVLGITSGTALVASCGVDKGTEKIIPYVIPPAEEVFPGKALYLNTTCTECPAGCGLEVRLNEKVYHGERSLFPTKLEGIAGHPLNNGALCARGQAGLYRLYHPDRIKRPMVRDASGNLRVATWGEALRKVAAALAEFESAGRQNLYFSGLTTGTLSGLIDRFEKETGVKRLPEFELFNHASLRKANEVAFGRGEIPAYRIEKADFLLSLGADLFETFLRPVNFAAQFARARQNPDFYWFHLEPHLSLTGVQANRRLTLKPRQEAVVLALLIHALRRSGSLKNTLPADILSRIPDPTMEEAVRRTGIPAEDLQHLIGKLNNARQPLVLAGGAATAHQGGLEVALLTALLQWGLGMIGNTVDFAASLNYDSVGSLNDVRVLLNTLDAGQVGVLFVAKSDPVSVLPEDWQFKEKMAKAGLTVGLSDFMTDSVRECDVILPLSHALESWGDAAPDRAVINAVQPAIEPQFDTRSEGDILLNLMTLRNHRTTAPSYKDYLFESWQKQFGEAGKNELLKKGYLSRKTAGIRVRLRNAAVRRLLQNARFADEATAATLIITPSIRKYDGRSKVLPLMNEIPDPLSTISYGDWISVPEESATEASIGDRDELTVSAGGQELRLAARVQPLLPAGVFMVQRDQAAGLNTAIDARTGEASWYAEVSLKKTGRRVPLPILSGSMDEDERGVLPEDEHAHEHEEEHGHQEGVPESLYPEHEHKDYRWGMAIDLGSCIGCNACAAACYVENNVPIVGREEHLKGREMSWIRLEPFIKAGTVEFVPMLCQQCDDAPCESVCPVYATHHSDEGLNIQVYNRCVGTRYCANNCPYKVRRFNWFDHRLPEPWDKMYNPAISVRGRGIMEKCTFCIQRIRQAKDHAKDEGRLVKDGEVVPACAQTCPTDAITFGNLLDSDSAVSRLAAQERAYRALEELGTQPAVYYLGNNEKDEA